MDGDIDSDGTGDITVSGNNTSQVFNIDDGTATVQTVNLEGLTITEGTTPSDGGRHLQSGKSDPEPQYSK